MSDSGLQGKGFLWGAVGVSALLAQGSPGAQGTCWFPQTVPHAVLTLLLEGLRGCASRML